MAFCLKYSRPDKTPKWLKIFTTYVSIFTISYLVNDHEEVLKLQK